MGRKGEEVEDTTLRNSADFHLRNSARNKKPISKNTEHQKSSVQELVFCPPTRGVGGYMKYYEVVIETSLPATPIPQIPFTEISQSFPQAGTRLEAAV